MNTNGLRLITDSEFREQFIHDYDFWLIIIAGLYFFIISYAQSFVIKHFKIFLIIAILLSLICNIFGIFILKTGSAIGVLNSPLVTLLSYRLLYEWYKKAFDKPPLSILEIAYSREHGIFYDRLLNIIWFLIFGSSTAYFTLIYGK